LLEARVSTAVSLILLRAAHAETDSRKHAEADNHMLVKSSAVCHSLLRHHSDAASSSAKASSAAAAAADDRAAGSAPAPLIVRGGPRKSSKNLSSKHSGGENDDDGDGGGSSGGGRPTGSPTGSSGTTEHFDLHVVHQMYSDQTMAFLSQSTEVPNFNKAKLAAPVKKFDLAAAALSVRLESMREKGLDPDSDPVVKAALDRKRAKEAEETVAAEAAARAALFLASTASGNGSGNGEGDDGGGSGAGTEKDEEATGGLNGKRMDKLRSDALFNYPVFAAGRVFTDSLMDLLMAQAYFNPTEVSFWEALLGIEDFDKVFN
jgi:uncharacterized membrane protein YgcG